MKLYRIFCDEPYFILTVVEKLIFNRRIVNLNEYQIYTVELFRSDHSMVKGSEDFKSVLCMKNCIVKL